MMLIGHTTNSEHESINTYSLGSMSSEHGRKTSISYFPFVLNHPDHFPTAQMTLRARYYPSSWA